MLAKYIMFTLAALFIGTPVSNAASWSIDQNILPARAYEKIKLQYPEIIRPDDLQNLLEDIAETAPMANLEIIWTNGQWRVRGKKIPLISDIKFDVTTRSFRRELDAATQPFLRKISSPEIYEKIKKAAQELMIRKGFPKANIQVRTDYDADESVVTVKVREGYPCIIQDVKVSFPIPMGHKLGVKAGKICDQDDAERSLETLVEGLRTSGYSQLRISDQIWAYDKNLNAAVFQVTGVLGPKIKYSIKILDKQYSLSDLFQEDLSEDISPDVISSDAVPSELVRRFRNQGFVDVSVTQKTDELMNGRLINHEYLVKTGTRYQLKSIEFEGVTAFTSQELLEVIGVQAFFADSNIPLNMSEIESGIDAIQAIYNQKGYWDVKIREPRIARNRENGTAEMVISIQEGLPRLFTAMTLDGIESVDREDISKLFQIDINQPFERGALLDFERAIRSAYVRKGYLYIDINLQLKAQNRGSYVGVQISTDIDEGKRVKIGDITVVGLNQTKVEVVTREFLMSSGDWYDPESIDSTRRALVGLGLFRTVQIQPTDKNAIINKMEIIDLQVEVREGDPGVISFGPGWSLYRGLRFGIETSYNNIGGYGRQVFARAKISEDQNQQAIDTRDNKTLVGRGVSIGYLEPYMLGLPLNGKVSLAHNAKADETWVVSRELELAAVHTLKRLGGASFVGGFFNQTINEEFGSTAQKDAEIIDSRTQIGSVGFRTLIDARNDLTWPTKGMVFAGELSYARPNFYSDLRYNHWSLDYSQYFEIAEDWVLATGFSYSAFMNVEREGDNPNRLTRTERLHLDGQKIVRGFEERTLGPRFVFSEEDEDGNTSITNEVSGGTKRATYKLELRRQLVSDTFALSLFVDSGTTFFDEEALQYYESENSEVVDNNPYDFEDILTNPMTLWDKNYVSYGLSMNFLTPVGSINLAYGLPWKVCSDQKQVCEYPAGNASGPIHKRGQFHMNVGATF